MTTTVQPTASRAAGGAGPLGTGSRFTRVLGIVVLVMVAFQLALALWWSPPELLQGQAVRLFYLHVPMAITGGYLAVGLLAVGSIGYLWKRTPFWDLLAASAGELALLFTGLTLLTGSLWGRPVWGTYWEWDPRLTLTAVLFLLLVGYRAMRNAITDPDVRARRSAVIGLLAAADVPLVRLSVDWWRGLHQTTTLNPLDPELDGLMLFTFFFSMVTFAALFLWLLVHRFRLAWLDEQVAAHGLQDAIAERRREAAPAPAAPSAPGEAPAPRVADPAVADAAGGAS
ncbi:MAG: cytochrome c biogenesis protein CcsA [Acidimicrobiia bacterium]